MSGSEFESILIAVETRDQYKALPYSYSSVILKSVRKVRAASLQAKLNLNEMFRTVSVKDAP